MPRYYPTIEELLAEDYFPSTIQELLQWLKPEEEKEARVMQILRGWGLEKPIGWRADREPDASWHRPSYHKPLNSIPEAEEETPSEAETKERCERHRRIYNGFVDSFFNGGQATLEQLNTQIRILNDYFVPKGCPAMPEFGLPEVSRR